MFAHDMAQHILLREAQELLDLPQRGFSAPRTSMLKEVQREHLLDTTAVEFAVPQRHLKFPTLRALR